MSLIPRLTLIGLYNYNNSLFSNLIMPEAVDNETLIDTILMEYGECPLVSPDLDYMLLAIGAWSRKWYSNIERIATALNAEYNPIYNYNRFETWSESGENGTEEIVSGTESGTENVSKTVSETGTKEFTDAIDTAEDGESTTENQVSAYNENDYQPSTKELIEYTKNIDSDESYDESNSRTINEIGNKTDSRTTGLTKNNTGTNSSSKSGNVYGNIGVTKSSDMVEDELNLRTNRNLYHIIAELFYKEFCVYVF